MVSISGNTNSLRLNPYGLSRFMSDVRTTSLCDGLVSAGAASCRSTSLFGHELKGFAVLPVVIE